MIFRRMNEKVGDDLGELDAMHIEDGDIHLIRDEDILLRFKCECSDENCDLRIPLKLSDYQDIHKDRSTFIVKRTHQVDRIEKIVRKEPEFSVVMKNNTAPEPGKKLNDTSVDNSPH
ncbi:MAG TPA: hypothetical protein VFI84_02025 [Candidatus Saccharimonadales bacterium]|nr:hypothetical protein [Candidatus Saccharimonadales bacterium]